MNAGQPKRKTSVVARTSNSARSRAVSASQPGRRTGIPSAKDTAGGTGYDLRSRITSGCAPKVDPSGPGGNRDAVGIRSQLGITRGRALSSFRTAGNTQGDTKRTSSNMTRRRPSVTASSHGRPGAVPRRTGSKMVQPTQLRRVATSRTVTPSEETESEAVTHWRQQTEYLRREVYVAERAYSHLMELGTEAALLCKKLLLENLTLRESLQQAHMPLPGDLLDYANIRLIRPEDLTDFNPVDEQPGPLGHVDDIMLPPLPNPFGDRPTEVVQGGTLGSNASSPLAGSVPSSRKSSIHAPSSPSALGGGRQELSNYRITGSSHQGSSPTARRTVAPKLSVAVGGGPPSQIPLPSPRVGRTQTSGISGLRRNSQCNRPKSMLPILVGGRSQSQISSAPVSQVDKGVQTVNPTTKACGVGTVTIPEQSVAPVIAKPIMVTQATQTESYDLCHPDTLFNLEVDNDYYREANRQLRCRLTNIISKHNALVELVQKERLRRQRKKERMATVRAKISGPRVSRVEAVVHPSPTPSKVHPRGYNSPTVLFGARQGVDPDTLSGLNTMVADIEQGMQKLALKLKDSPSPKGGQRRNPQPTDSTNTGGATGSNSPRQILQHRLAMHHHHQPDLNGYQKCSNGKPSPGCNSKTLEMDPLPASPPTEASLHPFHFTKGQISPPSGTTYLPSMPYC
ncbi:hypothetical protein IWQ62_002535 [Dispira parvispora]|uniref:Uncharacterized protein n=1 Tax=Dispira parvispora TaxID=1520584 RepID=A0A9W8E7W6_9FUNG|nr:hypothetical protein IWQ62_002535 [Dispira parvispora]